MAGVDESTHSGLAHGMGVERLIMVRKNLPHIRLIRSIETNKEAAELYDNAYPLLHEGDTSGYIVGNK